MLQQALSYLIDLGRINGNQFEFEERGDGRFVVKNSLTGEARIVDTTLPTFGSLASVSDLIAMAAFFKQSLEVNDPCGVFVSADKVVLQLSGSDHPKNKYVLPLRVNPAVAILKGVRNYSHKQLMKTLRVELAATTISPKDFKAVVSALKFETTSGQNSSVKKGDESIGKAVRAKVTGEGDISEDIIVTFAVYPDIEETGINTYRSILCSVIIEPLDGIISIIPQPGQIEQALISCQKSIANVIRKELEKFPGDSIQVFCGTFCE